MKKKKKSISDMNGADRGGGGGPASLGIIPISAEAAPSIFQSISAFVVTYINRMVRLSGSG